jgi:hypothetical protein
MHTRARVRARARAGTIIPRIVSAGWRIVSAEGVVKMGVVKIEGGCGEYKWGGVKIEGGGGENRGGRGVKKGNLFFTLQQSSSQRSEVADSSQGGCRRR